MSEAVGRLVASKGGTHDLTADDDTTERTDVERDHEHERRQAIGNALSGFGCSMQTPPRDCTPPPIIPACKIVHSSERVVRVVAVAAPPRSWSSMPVPMRPAALEEESSMATGSAGR